jgi:rod shape-determining protein MreC
MHKRSGKFGVFLLVVILSIMLIVFSQFSFFSPIRGFIEMGLISIEQVINGVTQPSDTSSIEKIKTENQKLKTQLAKEYLLIQENQAFRDQFAASEDQAKSLIPAMILNHRDSESILLNKGKDDKVTLGLPVIVNDNLVGIVTAVTPHTATIQLPIAKNFSVASQTMKTNALGVSRGQGEDGILFQNVLLSDKLEVADFVATKSESDAKNPGLPPNLIIGKITSIDKKASALYQTAKVESLIDFSKLRTVFILLR